MMIVATAIINPVFACANEVKIAIIDSGATAYVDRAISFTSIPANSDPLHHGTVVSELIRQGAPDATLYMLQVCEKIDGNFKPSNKAVKEAIEWAIVHQVNVVNMSLVIDYDTDIDNLITKASTQNGILFVAAAGNDSMKSRFAMSPEGFVTKSSTESIASFPASNPHVISVGGINRDGKLASYSNKGNDIYADGKVAGEEGSSFSCARISGKVAEILKSYQVSNKNLILAYLK